MLSVCQNNWVLVFFLWVMLQSTLIAQQPSRFGITDTFTNKNIDIEPVDTQSLVYHLPNNGLQLFRYQDSLLTSHFQQYDPTRKRDWDYFNLGNLGTAAAPLIWQSQYRKGMELGVHCFDIYKKNAEDLRFFTNKRAISDLSFSQGSEIANGAVGVIFSSQLNKNVSFALDYYRPYNVTAVNKVLLSNIYYDFPRTRLVNVSMGLNYKKENYNAFLIYTSNINTQLHTGGLPQDTIYDASTTLLLLPNYLTKASSRIQEKELRYIHYFNLNKQDSTQTKRIYNIHHELVYQNIYYKYTDEGLLTALDSAFYPKQGIDFKGIRSYYSYYKVENNFLISTVKGNSLHDNINDLSLGITHQIINYSNETKTQSANNLFANATLKYQQNSNFVLNAYGHLGLVGKNFGDYDFNGSLTLGTQKLGKIVLKANFQLNEPSVYQQEGVINNTYIYEEKFSKIAENSISANLQIPFLESSFTIQNHLLTNWIYRDSTFKTQQLSSSINILQLQLKQLLKYGVLHLDNYICLQKISNNVIRLPEFYTKNSLYIEGKIFGKVMLAQFGFDLRYAPSYQSYTYNPVFYDFALSNTAIDNQPLIDIFFNAKVRNFRFFFKKENISSFWNRSLNRQVQIYPIPDFTTRFGLQLLLRD